MTIGESQKPRAKSSSELSIYQRRRRLVLAALAIIIFALLLFVGSVTTTDNQLHEHIESAGICAIMVAILGRSWSTLSIGGKKNAQIVAGGPYSMTRNPLYFFSMIGAAGIGAMAGTATVALVLALLCYFAFQMVIRVEEAFLEANFGEPYREYMRAVPRFFPNPFLFNESAVLTVSPKLLYRTFADGLIFLAAYPFFELIEYFQETGLLPVVLRVY